MKGLTLTVLKAWPCIGMVPWVDCVCLVVVAGWLEARLAWVWCPGAEAPNGSSRWVSGRVMLEGGQYWRGTFWGAPMWAMSCDLSGGTAVTG